MPPPKNNVVLIRRFASSLILAFAVSANAQQTSSQNDEEIVRLSPFTVQENADIGRYQAAEVSSGTRIRMNLMDSTQSISVVTNEFLTDTGSARVLDAVKYIAGVGASTQPNSLDVMNVRGFRSYGTTLDGFNQFSMLNQEPIIIDRIEVVKGPNAILAPQGLPGGVVNNVTKKPLFTNQGYVSYQVGRWDANRAELDGNYVVNDKLALRVVGAVTDADDYSQREYHQNITVMPMFTYRISPSTEFTAQLQVYNASLLAINGNPVSLYTVNRSHVRHQEGLPRDFQFIDRSITRHQSGKNFRFFLTSQITDKLSMRLVGNWVYQNYRPNRFVTSSPNTEVLDLDPITGEWSWDGVKTNPNPTYQVGGDHEYNKVYHGNLQHDFVYEHTASTWKSQTIAGYAINYSSTFFRRKDIEPDGIWYDFTDNYTPPAYTLQDAWSANASSRSRSQQLYIAEVLNLFEDRLVLSGTLSYNNYFSDSLDNLTLVRPQSRTEVWVPSGGVVYKLTPAITAYYGYSKQELDGPARPDAGIPHHTVPSEQHEVGVRLKLLDGKLYTTFAYFDITQENLVTFNPANWVQPVPNPREPDIMSDRTAKGFEFEFAWAPTKKFSVIGSYTKLKNRDSDNMPYSNVAEEMAAIWGQYTFSETGTLRGLSIGIGANYVGERPSDVTGQFTLPPPGFTPARIQPSFWMPSYTVVEASVNYRFNKHWKAQLVINNLLDKDYITGSFNRYIFVSTPINPKFTLRYEF